MKKLSILILLIPFCVTSSIAQTFEQDASPGPNYEIASFRFWIPETTEKLKALLVVVPGYNGDGRSAAGDSSWQAFARDNDLALVACYFKDYKNPKIFYREASKGSGAALLDAIQKVGRKSGVPDIKNIPLILYGESAGGQFNYEFACWKPDKVLSFVVNKGGYYHSAIAPEECRNIPAIFFMGENDLYYRNDLIKGIFSVNRKLGAHWVLVSEKETHHEFLTSRLIALKYFESLLPLRLSPSGELLDVSGNEYYLGNWERKTIRAMKDKADTDSLSVWLPNEAFAKFWKNLHAYEKKGQDQTSRNLRIISHNVWYGFTITPERKRDWIEWMKAQEPDIVSLQELNEYTPEKLAEDAKSYGHPYSVLLKEEGFPTGITSRYPIEDIHKITEGFHHGLLRVKIEGIYIYVIHLHPSNWQTRKTEIRQVLENVSSLPVDSKVLLAGDFNTLSPLDSVYYNHGRRAPFFGERDSLYGEKNLKGGNLDYSVIQDVMDSGLSDLEAGQRPSFFSFPGTFPTRVEKEGEHGDQRRLDYFFASPNLVKQVIAAKIIVNNTTLMLSDHLPILVDLDTGK